MPAKGKKLSAAEREALAARLRAGREAAAAARDKATEEEDGPINEPLPQYEELAQPPAAKPQELAPEAGMAELTKQVMELQQQLLRIAMNQTPGAAATGPQVGSDGMMTGTFEKYRLDEKYYPSPAARLAKEPRLRRFAFDVNYELTWAVTRTQYQTVDKVNVVEPRFTVELIQIIMDDDGEPTTKRAILRSMVLHEDPQAALAVAAEQQLDPDAFGGEEQFLNEMRYLRIRNWLIDAFYPPKATIRNDRKEEVIGNRVVRIFEVSGAGATPAGIKFEDETPFKV